MKTKIFAVAILTICAVFLVAQKQTLAATFPLPGVTLFLKSLASGQVVAINTDNNGNFNGTVKEVNGMYNLFIGDESTPPVKMLAKNNIISGRIVVLTEGTTTAEVVPVPPVKKITPVKKAKTVKPVSKTAVKKK